MASHYFRRDPRDIHFVLFEQLGVESALTYQAFSGFSRADLDKTIADALAFATDELAPINAEGDKVGAVWDEGRVSLPQSFHDCWAKMASQGWTSITTPPQSGGRGLPSTMLAVVQELFFGANLAMALYAGMAAGNGRLIENFGTDKDRELFVKKMNTGIWGGTMCLTEPESGSDVGWLKTKAVPDPDSADPRIYKIEGMKRFITCGEHDLTENIVHLVLARIEGAPHGTKGVSLFIIPKIWVEDDGSLGAPNDVFCIGIEDKMGLHGSATARLRFGGQGGCRGILLGEPNSGMAKMFQMMNDARLATGLMGQGLAAAAYDMARYYATKRHQGPPFTNRRSERVRIIEHEDVRRMLMNLKSGVEAMRALTFYAYYQFDQAANEPDEAKRAQAQARLDLFTPLVKAYCSELGFQLCQETVQLIGGNGYIRPFPAEQYVRDVKVPSIWEGTTYIQSLDLVGRKLAKDGGAAFRDWLTEATALTEKLKDDAEFASEAKLVFKAVSAVGDFALRYMGYLNSDKVRLIPLTSTRFLFSMAETAMAVLMLDQAVIASKALAGLDPDSAEGVFYRGKIETARFFCNNTLTNVFGRHLSLQQEDTSAIDIPEGALTAGL